MSVWAFLKKIAKNTQKTVYQVKHQLLDEYMKAQLSSSSLRIDYLAFSVEIFLRF
jgi:predicted DNA-binding ribbon-helix-helix protein